MATITAFDAKTRSGELLERVTCGEEIVITRHGKPVARITPEGQASLASVQAAISGLLALQARIQRRTKAEYPLSGDEVRSAMVDGRTRGRR